MIVRLTQDLGNIREWGRGKWKECRTIFSPRLLVELVEYGRLL